MKHKCSICGADFELSYKPGDRLPPSFPFCSTRCKQIDLGKWLTGEYRITTPLPDVEMMSDAEREALAQYLLEAGEIDEIIDDES